MPQPLNAITLITTGLSIITFLTYGNPIQYLPRQWQQSASTSSTGNESSYVAPIVGCDGPEEEIVKDSYTVFLHEGYSLDQHKTFVGGAVNLSTRRRVTGYIISRHLMNTLWLPFALTLEWIWLIAIHMRIPPK